MKASELLIPGATPWDIRRNPNRGRVLPGDERGRYQIQVPFLLIVFNDLQSLVVPGDSRRSAELLAETLREVSFPNLSRFWLENSYGTFEFTFKLRTAIFDRPRNDRGGLPEPQYDGAGNLINGSQFPSAQRYIGFSNFVIWNRDPSRFTPGTGTNTALANYNAQSERNMALAALQAFTRTSYSWDDPGSLEQWLNFGIPPGDSKGFFLMASPSIGGGGWRNSQAGLGFGTWLPGGPPWRFAQSPINIAGRTLRNYIFSTWRWETFAHELGHAIGAPDLYIAGSAAGKLTGVDSSLSLMGSEGKAPHADAFLKFRWDWLDPQVLVREPHRRRIVLPPVYENPANALLIRPLPKSHADEFFLVEVRGRFGNAWDGRPKQYDQRLGSALEGVQIYHINAENPTPSAPKIDLEGETPGSPVLAAYQAGEAFTPPASSFYDGKETSLSIHVRKIDAAGRATLDIGWNANAGDVEILQSGSRGTLRRVALHTDWRETWQVIPGNFCGSGYSDLLLYDPTTGEAEVLQGLGGGRFTRRYRHRGWRRTWSIIIPGNFTGSGYTDVWLYDRNAGVGELLRSDGQGRLQSVARHTNWRRTWSIIAAGNFGGDGYADLLFYDRTTGTADIYTIRSGGQISHLRHFEGWRRTWDAIVVGRFGGSSYDDLLFYDRRAGEAEFHLVGASAQLSRTASHRGWRKTWWIRSGNFGGDGNTDLFFYDRTTGEAAIYTVRSGGQMSLLRSHKKWRRTWDAIALGNFSGGSRSDIMLYSRSRRGEGEFLQATGTGRFNSLDRLPRWRKTWHLIIPGTSHDERRTDLHFYDPTMGQLDTYQTNGSGGMSRRTLQSDWRKTWDLAAVGNFGGSSGKDVVFYDPASGELQVFVSNARGQLVPLADAWRTRQTWTHLVSGPFSGGSFDDLLLYDGHTGEAIFLRTPGNGRFTELKRHTGWRRTWFAVVAGRFHPSDHGLALYDPTAGHIVIYRVTRTGDLQRLRLHTNQRRTWSHLVSGNFGGSSLDDLLLYDPTRGEAQIRASNGAGGLRLLRRSTNWRRTWAMIVPGKFGGSSNTDLLLYDRSSE